MGLYISKLYELLSAWGNSVPARILLLGLDNAGKTAILYKLKLGENVTTIPTIGFNVETVSPCKGVTFTVWDVGGQDKIRRLWKHYYQNTNGLFFVVDSSDTTRMAESAEELQSIVNDDTMYGVPVVIIANKQDLPGALSCSEVAKRLNLDRLSTTRNKWYIQASCAITGEGIFEAVNEMARFVREKEKSSS